MANPGTATPVPLVLALATELADAGYAHVLTYDPVTGFSAAQTLTATGSDTDQAMESLGLTPANGAAPAGLDLFTSTLEQLELHDGPPIALIVDFASRMIVRNEYLQPPEHNLFTRAEVFSHRAKARPNGPNGAPRFNSLIWIADKEGDLPDWFLINNPRIRHIPVAHPDTEARRSLAQSVIRQLPGASGASSADLAAATKDFTEQTDGMLLADVRAIAELGRNENVWFQQISDAVRRYKVGVTDDQWKLIPREKVETAEDTIRQRVKGQQHAVTHVLDIIRRAVTGVGASRRSGRPRGVVFLAGPTGVGKTELAKSVTELLFGDAGSYIRFDMSEFGAEHSDQRLIGAPPGYVGYDQGGELTNAIREKPFSVVLFDEIEKAHPRILDKFLQILDDGVLTSGRGEQVYFSEALIMFTSNLGVYRYDDTGQRVANVTPNDSHEIVEQRLRGEIDRHFKVELNRPEILNRIGENIIVFDFIRPDVALEIFDAMVDALLGTMPDDGTTVTITGVARDTLANICLADLSNGGRGIRNQLERHLVNPLARALFPFQSLIGKTFEITNVVPQTITTLTVVETGSRS